MRSGYTNLNSGYLRYVGTYGHYSSSDADSVEDRYRLILSTTRVYPASANAKHYGYSARCLASGAWFREM